jgi:hypothetical protein
MELPDRVKLRCPLCPWESEEVTVKNGPNGVWYACQEAGKKWHPHFDNTHKPAPVRVLIYAEGTADGTT